ncbi:MAG TPA: TonB-dependent receptor, partial [Steroidobacteraceae bacterium]|nr:TonB-dependent receptor [Steroidobacteraceae bacterium]
NYELGAKWHLPSGTQFEAALFRANTRDELAVARNSGGRSSYQNIDSARRQGFETSAAVPLSHELQLEISYTWLDATFTSDFKTCVVAGCTVPNVLIPAGSRIPGVAEHQGMARLQWSPGRWSTALEFQGVSELVANDVGSEAAPGYGLLNIEAGRDWTFGQTTLRAFARVENLLDHQYIGSVIVNDGNGRYYESGPERSAMLGLQWQWR